MKLPGNYTELEREGNGSPEHRATVQTAASLFWHHGVSQTAFPGAHVGVPPAYEMLKEEHEVGVLGASESPASMTTTVINICSETSVSDHIIWSLFNTLFLNVCCLGFMAFAYSAKPRDQKMVGNVLGAQSYASTAKCLNVCTLVLGILLTIVFIIIFATGSLMIFQVVSQILKEYGDY
nr:LOW QUALITY PROTEIN: interferon-induced transmembrane protein 3-like [Vicugna pacos]